MIDLDKVYTFEECAKLCGRKEAYFRRRAQNGVIIANAVDPNRPFLKAIYGRDLIRYLQTINWGVKLLAKFGIATVDESLFVYQDREILEAKLKHLLEVKEQRIRSLHITLNKIDDIEKKIKKFDKAFGRKDD